MRIDYCAVLPCVFFFNAVISGISPQGYCLRVHCLHATVAVTIGKRYHSYRLSAWMRVLEIDSTRPMQAKRCSVEDAIKNCSTDYRRRSSRTDTTRRNARKGQALELARSHISPRATPNDTASTSELREAIP